MPQRLDAGRGGAERIGDVWQSPAVVASSRLSTRGRRLLWATIALGAAVRLVLAFTTDGVAPDLRAYRTVEAALGEAHFHLYDAVNRIPFHYEWPYPPGYLPVLWPVAKLADLTGLSFASVARVPIVAADMALAWVVQFALGRAGHAERTRLAGAAIVALGPVFVINSGYHGQIDAVAVLPAVLALVAWRSGHPRRALAAGALIGLAGAIKAPLLLVALAFAPSARSLREGVRLGVAAVAVPLLALLPFLVATPSAVVRAFSYGGLQGLGGLSLVLQPDRADVWLRTFDFPLHGIGSTLHDHAGVINAVWVVAIAVVLARTRPRAAEAAVLLWLAFYVFGTGFTFGYLAWGIPFAVLAGRLRAAALLQLLVLGPELILYLGPWRSHGMVVLYAVLMIGVWLVLLVALAAEVRGRLRAAPAAAT